MHVFLCNNFAGHWPVGTAAVIVAPNEATARDLLDAGMIARGLKPDPTATITKLDTSAPLCVILNDGDY
jgi:hypothetical protein